MHNLGPGRSSFCVPQADVGYPDLAYMTVLVRLFSKALRNIIAKSPPSLPEPEAKTSIKEKINEFINTRITLAAEEIAKNAITKIREGDVILTYGRFVCRGPRPQPF